MKRHIAIPGALLLSAAFVRAALNVAWDAASLWAAVAGALVVGAAIAWNRREVAAWLRDPRGVFAVTTGIGVAMFVAALVLLNIAVWYYPWSIDLTASGRNQVADETRRILDRLEAPVTLRQFGRTSDPGVEALLRGFERETRRLRIDFVDVDRDRAQANRYGVVRLGTVITVAGDKFRKVEAPNEQALVTAILQLTAAREHVVCFVTGHGERGLADEGAAGLTRLATTLAASNYETDRIGLLEGDVPERCSATVVAAPRLAFSDQELARLDSYLARGGRVAMFVEPDPAPSFAEWLRPRGIDPRSGVVVDTSGAGQSVGGGPRTPLAIRYVDHPVTRGFDIATMYDGARPLAVLRRADAGRAVPLAQTGPNSFSTTMADAVPAFVDGRDTAGPLTLAAVTASGGSGSEERQARLAVFGDVDVVSNALLGRQGNRDFVLRTLAWLLGEEEATIVAVDNRENRRIELTERMRAWMYIVNLGVLPAIPLCIGIVVFLRSRR